MIKQIFTTIIFTIFVTTSLQSNNLLNTENKKLSYSFGYTMGESLLKNHNTQLEADIIINGIEDAFSNKKPLIDEYEIMKKIYNDTYKDTQKHSKTPNEKNSLSKKENQELSYSLGYKTAKQFINSKKQLNIQIITSGLKDIILNKKPKLTKIKMDKIILEFNENRKKEIIKKQKALKQANIDFLISNKKKKGIRSLKSGLQYKIIDYGTGEISPKKTDTVTIHFSGKLIDGTIFNSSYERKKPLTLSLDRFIPGFKEILLKMRVGDKWRVFIPTELSRALHAVAPRVPQDSTLIFDIELLKISK